MNHPVKHLMANLAPHLPRCIYLACGMSIIAMALLTKPWLACRQLAWQREIMAMQAQRLISRHKAYKQFYTAVVNDDPVLLEHLAYHHLSLKPIGAAVLAVESHASSHPADRRALGIQLTVPDQGLISTAGQPRPTNDHTDTFERTTHHPHKWKPINSRLIRLTTGPARLPLIAAGVLCLSAGLWSSLGQHRGNE